MKTKVKSILIYLVVIMMLCMVLPKRVNAEGVTLGQIVEKFKQSSFAKTFEVDVTNDANSITVSKIIDEKMEKCVFILEGNILSIEIEWKMEENDYGSVASNKSILQLLSALNIADCIGQLHGYEEGEVASTLNSEKSMQYTIDREGIEQRELDSGNILIKMDINKKIPLVDFSNDYFEVSDFEGELKKFIAGNGSAQKGKGNLIFWKGGYDNEMTVFIGEKKALTENTYKSILSMLQVMFDSENVVNYFKMNYPKISMENKEFTGFKVEINPEKTDMEKTVLGEGNKYSFIRLTIDKETAIEAATATKTTVTNNSNEVNQNITELPQTGEGLQMTDILMGLIVISVIGLIVLYKSSKKVSNK